jgi:hypothetical protein
MWPHPFLSPQPLEIRSKLKVWTDKGRVDDAIKMNHKEMGTM